ncbi:transporter substrate-binding domain-containing protein [Verticiella sediminum]|uniref:Transporter substrate-binding domain-containing protein n=1 Tax=Verticiella sediminum TaxID=1247510 RepID=A0A556AQA4_9BURK|nr:transporter substrate-binding domain-containing protein [Verticiella sediminum]TSH95076.1 transporter substrate-binding domain-containing protein [Verticiella sediminum]
MQRRTFLSYSVALGALVLPVARAAADTLEDIRQRAVVRIAIPQDAPPFGSVGADLKPAGYDVDVAQLIGRGLGAKVELVQVTGANRIPYLVTRRVDMVIYSLGRNAERERAIDFSVAYAPFFNGVFGPADLPVKSAQDLAGRSVAVTRGSVEDLELTQLAPPDTTIRRYEDGSSTMAAFLAGQTQLVATGNVVAAAILRRSPSVRPEVKFMIRSSPCHIGVNKGEPALLAEVDRIIAEARANGELDRISERWLAMPLPADLG